MNDQRFANRPPCGPAYYGAVFPTLFLVLLMACSATPEPPRPPVPADGDLDGIADKDDPCPTVFDPSGAANTCAPWLPEGWPWRQELSLANGGGVSRTVGAPVSVEIPLAAGYLNSDVAGYWTFDDHDLSLGTFGGLASGNIETAGSIETIDDGRGNPVFARFLNGLTQLKVAPLGQQFGGVWTPEPVRATPTPSDWTVCLRYRPAAAALQGTHLLFRTSPVEKEGAAVAPDVVRVGAWLQDGRLRCRFDTNGNAPVFDQGDTVIAPDAWHQACIVVRGARGDVPGSWSCWQDDRQIGQHSATHTQPEGAAPLVVGSSDPAVYDDGFVGGMDDLLVLRRALEPAAIATWFRSGRPFGERRCQRGQADGDDLRVTASNPSSNERLLVPFELTGARPGSDSNRPGVQSYWRLGRAESGPTSSSNLGGLPTRGRFGKILSASRFDGVAKRATTELVPRRSKRWSVSLWLRLDLNLDGAYGEAQQWLLSQRGDRLTAPLALVLDRSLNKLTFRPGVPGMSLEAQVAGLNETGRWRHIGATFERGEMALFVDGVEVARAAAAKVPGEGAKRSGTPPPDPETDTGDGQLSALGGKAGAAKGGVLVGALDEVTVHSVARTASWFTAQVGLPTLHSHTWVVAAQGKEANPSLASLRLHWGNPAAQAPLAAARLNRAALRRALLDAQGGVDSTGPQQTNLMEGKPPSRLDILGQLRVYGRFRHRPTLLLSPKAPPTGGSDAKSRPMWDAAELTDEAPWRLLAVQSPRYPAGVYAPKWSPWAVSISPDRRYVVVREIYDQPGEEWFRFSKQRLRVLAMASGRQLHAEAGKVITPTGGTLHWSPTGALIIRDAVVNDYNKRCLYQWFRRPRGSWQEQPFLPTPLVQRNSIVALVRRPGARTYAAMVRTWCDYNSTEVVLLDEHLKPVKMLTADKFADAAPVWSSDGAWLVWRKQHYVDWISKGAGYLYRADPAGELTEMLWAPGANLSASPHFAWPTDQRVIVERFSTDGGGQQQGSINASAGGGLGEWVGPPRGVISVLP